MTLTNIPARARDLGGFSVRRILPAIGRKLVGPFIFFDHMGPADFAAGEGMDVRPHPHVGLSTVTYLFEGAIEHRDSLGSDQVIKPGDVNWMTAGQGIVHSERTPAAVRAQGGRVEGIQAWVALPLAAEDCEPGFWHHPGATIPAFEVGGVPVRLIAGAAFGRESPVRVASDTIYLELRMRAGQTLVVPADGREIGVYLVAGAIRVNDEAVAATELVVGAVGQALAIGAQADAHVMVIGGTPLDGKREIWWNFVASTPERLEAAKRRGAAGEFPKVPSDEQEFIPLPSS
jgi:redox-sensitive bicupin YhaK (pirin superfamily)